MIAAHILGWGLGEPGNGGLKILVVLIQPLHPVEDPTSARLPEGHLPAAKSFQNPSDDHAQGADHLLERVREGMGLEWMV